MRGWDTVTRNRVGDTLSVCAVPLSAVLHHVFYTVLSFEA